MSHPCYHSAPTNIRQGVISLGVLALLFLPWFCRWSYEIFFRGHQILTGLCLGDLAASSDQKQLLKTLPLGCVGDLGADLMLTAGDPSISNRAVCGPRCSQGFPITQSEEI